MAKFKYSLNGGGIAVHDKANNKVYVVPGGLAAKFIEKVNEASDKAIEAFLNENGNQKHG